MTVQREIESARGLLPEPTAPNGALETSTTKPETAGTEGSLSEVVEVSSGKNLPVETGTTSPPVTVGINGKTYQRKPRPAKPAVAEAVVEAAVGVGALRATT